MTGRGPMLSPSPVALAFPHIEWDRLASLRLTAQETALLRMAETNPIEYTLADSRDASMYARVLLKLLAEAAAAGAGFGECKHGVSNAVIEMCFLLCFISSLFEKCRSSIHNFRGM